MPGPDLDALGLDNGLQAVASSVSSPPPAPPPDPVPVEETRDA